MIVIYLENLNTYPYAQTVVVDLLLPRLSSRLAINPTPDNHLTKITCPITRPAAHFGTFLSSGALASFIRHAASL